MSADQEQRPLPQRTQRNAKEEGHDSFFCFNLSPQHGAVIYVEHGNLD
jgi:hypothetical protein